MSRKVEDLLEFGDYRIDVGQRVLLLHDAPLALAPKVFDTLLALVEEPGRVLEKDYLLHKVWPDTFVEEGSLTRNVSTLRKLLGTTPDGHEYIETIPKRGYRFQAPVRVVPATSGLAAGASGSPEGIAVPERHPQAPDTSDARTAPGAAMAMGRPASRRRATLGWAAALLLVIASSVAGWRLLPAAERPRSINSLAVLPLVNMSGNQDDEYFSDGLTEELINAVANIPGLKVVSRTTVFQFKNRAGDIRELGRRMNVDAIMEGSVRRDQGRVRVTVQLNNVQDGYHYWSRTWDSNGNALISIQQEIAQQVALALRPSDANVAVAARPLTTDPEAYNLYLQGQFHRRRGSTSGMRRAVEFYRQAIDRDPSFAEAYVGLAIVLNEAGTDGRLQPSEAFPQSRDALVKALELNPLLAAAHSAQGWISMHYDWNWAEAERRLRRAIDLGPSDPETHHAYSHYLLARGRHRESLVESQRAIDLDPLNAGMRGHLVLHFNFAHDFVSAIEAAKTTVDIDPAAPEGWTYRLTAYEASNRLDEALDVRAHLGQPPALLAALRTGLAAGGAPGYWRALRDSELLEGEDASDYTLAKAYVQLGQRREALEAVARAFEERAGWLVYLKVNPYFDALHGDPRFEELVTRIGLRGQ